MNGGSDVAAGYIVMEGVRLMTDFECGIICMLILSRCASGMAEGSQSFSFEAAHLHIYTSSHLHIFVWESRWQCICQVKGMVM